MDWQNELKENVTTARELADALGMSPEWEARLAKILESYPMTIPRGYLSLVDKDDPADPIRRMCVPAMDELSAGGDADTSGEGENTKVEGLQHKYGPTGLMLSTNVCAMYCRHCFRKRLVGLSDDEIARMFDHIGDYLRAHEEIDNVLVSGGDAFLNSNHILRHFLDGLCAIDHIRMIRFGTRTPVVLPSRISGDAELLDMLTEYGKRKQLYVVTQFNHPRELTPQAQAAIDALLERGVPVSNQTVLLRGVNDDPNTLAALMSKLVSFGVAPYYIFQCRPVAGVHTHFQVPLRRGYQVVESAKQRLNGHAKRFRYCMSHVTGKIEILGELGGEMLFKYHQAKRPEDAGRIFTHPIPPEACWLPDGGF